MSRKFVVLWSIALVAALAMGACGGGDAPAAEAPAAAPLAATEEATAAVAEVATEVATEAPAEVAAPAEPVAEAFDVNGALDAFASAIPDGFASMGKLDDVKAAVEAGALLIDVREASEYAEGHIPGAINIPLRTVAQNLDKIPTDKPVLVYCASGLRAGTTVATLRALGYDNVKSFPGGWKAWSGANEAVSTEATAATVVTPKEVNPELLAVADAFLSGIPEGFYSIGAVEKLQEAIDNGAVLIDVREAGEFADGAIPGAINIPIRTLLQNLDKVPADQPVITYCASGHRAAMANAILHMAGFDNVRVFPAGYGAWEAAQETAAGTDTVTETMTETMTETVPAEVAQAVDSAFDINATVDAFLSTIPEGYFAIGQIDAVKDAMASANPLLIDVRETSEYAEGHIPGAVNIPLRTLADNLDKLPTDRPIIVYCASGLRAGTATASLHVLGFDNVKAFPGSWKAWSAAGEETSTDAVAAETVTPKDVDPETLAAVAEFLTNVPEGYFSVGDVEMLAGAIDAGAALIDVREAGEFAEGHIPGAVNIPIRTLAQNLASVPADKPVIVYCASGHRAAMANASLHLMGFDNVRVFPAGYGAWEAAGNPTE
jgi:rhodanese-related sulfurtransferase